MGDMKSPVTLRDSWTGSLNVALVIYSEFLVPCPPFFPATAPSSKVMLAKSPVAPLLITIHFI